MTKGIAAFTGVLSLVALGMAAWVPLANAAAIDVYAMSNAGNSPGQLYGISVTGISNQLIGNLRDPGDPTCLNGCAGWSTVAITPDNTLYFLRRGQASDHIFSVNADNIVTSSGVITNLVDRGSTGLGGNLDGLTAGPDGNIYLTAYQNSNINFATNGLFRFNPTNGQTTYVGTFANNGGPGGRNSFYTDLSFDLNGDLVGTGFDTNGAFIPYRLNGATVLSGSNLSFSYVDAFTSWNGLADGLAFDRLTGDLYASSDTGGVFLVNRTTGAIIRNVGNTSNTSIGTDLAVRADTIPNGVPEPSMLSLLAVALTGLCVVRRRNK